jgi:uncharacterized protein (DUF488 family)
VPTLATIGYEGTTIEPFIRALKKAQIRRLADIRDLPLSRKKGFSKTALAARLEQAGIVYLHIKALGDPKPGRLAARRGEFAAFKRIYANHLGGKPAQAALRELGKVASQAKTCLLCFEQNPSNCHRQIVASRLAKTFGLEIVHLQVTVQTKSTTHEGRTRVRGSLRSGEGATAP